MHLLGPAPIVDIHIPNVVARFEHIPAAAVLEEGIHLLQRAARRLRVHEYDEGDAEDIEPEEQQQRAVADRLEQERRDHGDDAVADRPAHHGPCSTFCPHVQGEDFGRIQPRGRQPGRAKGACVEEDHGGDTGAIGTLFGTLDLCVFVQDTGDQQDERHAHGSPDHGGAPSEAIERVDGEDDAEHVGDVVEASQQLRQRVGEAGIFKEADGVDGNDANTDEFLHDLQPDSEEDAPAQLGPVAVIGEQHGPIVVCS